VFALELLCAAGRCQVGAGVCVAKIGHALDVCVFVRRARGGRGKNVTDHSGEVFKVNAVKKPDNILGPLRLARSGGSSCSAESARATCFTTRAGGGTLVGFFVFLAVA
jgi:hypothetical protein